MIKKNKGFTLIELLAAMVILGLLFAVALPTVLGLFSRNTNKVYVNDAIKLATQAEYKIRAASTTIERPDDGDCIIMSLKYLDNGDFDEAPNNGSYDDSKSFVVVKNVDGDLEYSVKLVENRKDGGYRGVKLTLVSNLNKGDSTKYVVDFKDSELFSVADDEKMYSKYVTDINSTDLGKSYVNSVLKVYDKNALRDNTTATDSLAPKIVKASISSASNKNFNSLDAKLSLTVSDKDTDLNKLKVKYNVFYDDEMGNYPDDTSSCSSGSDPAVSGCFNWGTTESTFNKNFDFSSKLSYTDENKSTLKMYLIVYDPEGNYDSRIVSYTIHKNRAPTINSFKVYSTNSKYNVSKARVRMDITDDIDSVSSLKYCLTEDKDNGCKKDSDFKKYSTDSSGYISYTFMCNGSPCSPDGLSKTLYLFVKDSAGLVSEAEAVYGIYKNQPPHFKDGYSSIVLSPSWQKYGRNENSQLVLMDSLEFKIDTSMIEDDLTDHDNIKVRLQEVDVNGNVKSDGQNFDNPKSSDKTYKLSELGSIIFKFSGNYLGSRIRYLNATFIDEQGAKFELTKSADRVIVYNNVYHNSVPTINEFTVSSNGSACSNCSTTIGGSLNTTIKMNVSDDIDTTSKLEYQICTESKDSTQKCSSYAQYDASDRAEKQISYTIKSPSNYVAGTSPTEVKFTLNVKDSDGAIGSKTFSYNLYPNLAPSIDISGVNSKDELYNTNEAEVNFSVSDDFQSSSGKYRVCSKENGSDDSTYVCTDYYSLSGNYGKELNTLVKGLPNAMGTGKTYVIKVEASDGLSTTSAVKKYKMYKDEAPVVNSFNIKEKSFDEDTNKVTFDVEFDVKDPFDTYKVCINEDSKAGSCKNYGDSYDGGYKIEDYYVKDKAGVLVKESISDFDIEFVKTYSQDTDVKLYLHVLDNHGNETVYGTVYNACFTNVTIDTATATYGDSVNTYVYKKSAAAPSVEIDRNSCSGNCYYISNDPIYEEYVDENGETQIKLDENNTPIKKYDSNGDELTELSSVTPNHTREQLISYSRKKSNNVYGTYIMTSTFNSKKVPNKACLTGSVNEVDLNCSFYTCFLNGAGNMSSRVIGVVWHEYENETTEEFDNAVYTCLGYYKLYKSKYDPLTDKVTLTYRKKELCDSAVEDEDEGAPYLFKEDSANPYIRGNDYAQPES